MLESIIYHYHGGDEDEEDDYGWGWGWSRSKIIISNGEDVSHQIFRSSSVTIILCNGDDVTRTNGKRGEGNGH